MLKSYGHVCITWLLVGSSCVNHVLVSLDLSYQLVEADRYLSLTLHMEAVTIVVVDALILTDMYDMKYRKS